MSSACRYHAIGELELFSEFCKNGIDKCYITSYNRIISKFYVTDGDCGEPQGSIEKIPPTVWAIHNSGLSFCILKCENRNHPYG